MNSFSNNMAIIADGGSEIGTEAARQIDASGKRVRPMVDGGVTASRP